MRFHARIFCCSGSEAIFISWFSCCIISCRRVLRGLLQILVPRSIARLRESTRVRKGMYAWGRSRQLAPRRTAVRPDSADLESLPSAARSPGAARAAYLATGTGRPRPTGPCRGSGSSSGTRAWSLTGGSSAESAVNTLRPDPGLEITSSNLHSGLLKSTWEPSARSAKPYVFP